MMIDWSHKEEEERKIITIILKSDDNIWKKKTTKQKILLLLLLLHTQTTLNCCESSSFIHSFRQIFFPLHHKFYSPWFLCFFSSCFFYWLFCFYTTILSIHQLIDSSNKFWSKLFLGHHQWYLAYNTPKHKHCL